MLQFQENGLFKAVPGKHFLLVIDKEFGGPIGVIFEHQDEVHGISLEEDRVMGPYNDGPQAFEDMFGDE